MRTEGGLSLIVCLLILTTVVPAVHAQAQTEEIVIRQVGYTGSGDVAANQEQLYLWQSASHRFQVLVATQTGSQTVAVCLASTPTDATETQQLACRSVSLAANTVEDVSVTVNQWPGNLTGHQTLRALVREQNASGPIVAQETLSLTVIRKDGDRDVDGLTNQREVALGTNITDADTDTDGLDDQLEVRTYETDPTKPDSDSDNLLDGAEVTTHGTEPRTADTDDDGLPDGVEIQQVASNPNKRDTDGDSLGDASEVNTYHTNATVADTDGDGLGDGLEVNDKNTNPTNTDTDGDGLSDGQEVTIYGTDPTQGDTDGDGVSDAAEVTNYQTDPTTADTDGDGLSDGAEIRTHGTNPNTRDTDSDGIPDAKELNQGTDPTAPTANPHDSLLSRVMAFGTSARGGAVIGGSLVAIGAIAVYYYRSDTSIASFPLDRLRDDSVSEQETDEVRATNGASPSVMTNEERIVHLLEEHGGRMLQSDIVEAADWSKATVSRVLSEMETNDAVTRVDIGKGNLVALPGNEPENSESTFSE